MKGSIISSHHCVEIDNNVIDMFYEFKQGMMSFYVNGTHFTTSNFNPGHKQFNYSNLLELGVTMLAEHNKRQQRHQQESESDNQNNNTNENLQEDPNPSDSSNISAL